MRYGRWLGCVESRSFTWTVITTADNVGRSARGTGASSSVRGDISVVGSIATHAFLLSKRGKPSTVALLFSCYCSLVGVAFLLLLEGGKVLATLAFDIRVLGVNVKVKRMVVPESRRGLGLRAKYVDHGVRRGSGFGDVIA